MVSIYDYLSYRGFRFKKRGNIYFCKSPFCRDTNWSFAYYPNTNSFYDWSQGFGGNLFTLIQKMENVDYKGAVEHLKQGRFSAFLPNYKQIKKQESFYDFEPSRYYNVTDEELEEIKNYAKSRGFIGGYTPGVYFTKEDDTEKWVRHPSIMFIHRDVNLKPCGAKFRKLPRDISIDKDNGVRFTSRGKMGIFMLEYNDPDNFGNTTLYVVEGEGNAISLWQHCQEIKKNCVVISFGGVGQYPDKLPPIFDNINDRRLIIDFDGNEKLYLERLKAYQPFNLKPLTMMLPKGEDINSLYIKGRIDLITHLL